MHKAVATVLILLTVLVLPGHLRAQGPNPTVQEIRELIRADNEFTRQNLRDQEGGYSAEGSLEFWSSGGLVQQVPADPEIRTYEYFNMTPKYIWVLPIEENVAVAQYYVEGSFKETGMPPVQHYFTRVTQVFVKENGEWKIRAGHWSPVQGGSGTNQTDIGG